MAERAVNPLPHGKRPSKPLLARRCKYCRANFIPQRSQDKDAKFCCPNHRKAFWRYGGLPFDKLMVRIEREIKRIVREELQKALTARDQPQ
jgi:hypothetical protein